MQKKEDAFFLYLNPLRSDQIRSACSDHSRVLTIAFYVLIFFFFFAQSIDQLIEDTVPASIRMQKSMKMDDPLCKLNISLYICVHIWFNNPVMWPEEAARPVSMRSIQSDKSHQKKSTRKHCVSPPTYTHTLLQLFLRGEKVFFFYYSSPHEWSQVSGWNVGCTSIVRRGSALPW